MNTGGDSGRSTGRDASKFGSASPRVVPLSQTMGGGESLSRILMEKQGEKFTARGTIVKNLQTIQTTLDVRTFLWYLKEKVRSIEKVNMSIFQLLACRICRRNWTRSGRVLRMIGKGKRRLNKWSDITTLMKAKINSDMLAQRLLTSE